MIADPELATADSELATADSELATADSELATEPEGASTDIDEQAVSHVTAPEQRSEVDSPTPSEAGLPNDSIGSDQDLKNTCSLFAKSTEI